MKKIKCYLAVFVVVMWTAAQLTVAAVPQTLNYQGVLTDSSGVPENTTVNIVLRIFDSANAGNQLFAEEHSGTTVTDGIFSLAIGSGTNPSGAFDAATLANNSTWLELEINTEVQMPRQAFLSVPYAMVASEVESGAIIASHLATDAVTADAIASDAVTADEIGQSAVGESELADGAVIAELLDEDGAGTNLDADLLDGQHASDIIAAAADEVRTPISSLPYTITTSGSYYLTGNLSSTNNGIYVNASDVKIDLMGFTISGTDSGGYHGVYSTSSSSNIEIVNGSVRDYGGNGVFFNHADQTNIRLIALNIIDNVGTGIDLLGDANLIQNTVVEENSGNGIRLQGDDNNVSHSLIKNNGSSGINTSGAGSKLLNNHLVGNGHGAVVGLNAIIDSNVVSSNSGWGLYVAGDSVLENNVVTDSGLTGVLVLSGGVVLRNNNSSNNQQYGFAIGGTAKSVLDSNLASNNNLAAGSYSDFLNCLACVDLEGNTPIFSVPVTITEPGNYYLTKNMTASDSSVAIVIDGTSDVTIDFKGFEIDGAGLASRGVSIDTYVSNITIKNGAIKNTTAEAIFGWYTYDVTIRDMFLVDTGSPVIYLIEDIYADKRGHRIENCNISGGSSSGIYVGKNSFLTGNTVRHVGGGAGYAVRVGDNSVVENNVITDNNVDNALEIDGEYIAVRGNTVANNSEWGIFSTGSSYGTTIENNEISGNNLSVVSQKGGVRLGDSSRLSNNTIAGNYYYNISIYADNAFVDKNTIIDGSVYGLYVQGSSSGYRDNVLINNATAVGGGAITDLGGNVSF